jgi:hypothetical protein
MASEKQLAANRANALKSRGPRSVGGKMRASRNATSHGLAANFWKDPSAIRSVEVLTNLLCKAGHCEREARLLAVAEYETRSVHIVRSRLTERLLETSERGTGGASVLAALQRLQRIDRYEKRASSRKKRLFLQMQED